MPAFTAFKVLPAPLSPLQEMTVVGGNKFVLASNATFLAFDKAFKITVALEGEFYSDNIGVDAVDIGNVSTWAEVEVIIDAGCTIFGRGGNGGVSSASPTVGSVGGPGLDVNSANSSAVLKITNNGEIGGGGGGGGAGTRSTASDFAVSNGKEPTCSASGVEQRGSGGGGGGRSTDNATSAGGAGSTSTGGCAGPAIINGTAGALGNEIGGGARGVRGQCVRNLNGGTSCAPCTAVVGNHGAAGGSWATSGASSNSAGGAGGTSATNQGSADFTNNGTIH